MTTIYNPAYVFNPAANAYITVFKRFHGDREYNKDMISSMLDQSIDEYKKLVHNNFEMKKLVDIYTKNKDRLISAIEDGIHMLDHIHSATMIFVIRNYEIQLIRGYEWVPCIFKL